MRLLENHEIIDDIISQTNYDKAK